MKQNKINLSVYTILHFLVDLSCIFYLMGMVYVQLSGPDARIHAAVAYNALAFAVPMLLGLAADLAGKNALTSCLGCAMILLSYLLNPSPWISVVLIGTGNGLFHIGGGRQVLLDAVCSSRDQTAGRRWHFAPAGIFISSGALGVYLGRFLSANFRHTVFLFMWICLAAGVLILGFLGVRQWNDGAGEGWTRIRRQKIRPHLLLLSLMIFIVVIIRSYYGFTTVYSWNRGFVMGLIFTLCIVVGKAAGGIAADCLGTRLASVISLAGAGILALFAGNSPVLGCASILLFNMTMPITLTLLSDLWEEVPGFAFGTLMMALFLGTLPNMVWNVTWFSSPAGQMGLCLISLVLLLAACGPAGRSNDHPGA